MRLYFGTDGVRGPYGGPVINETFATRLGMAAGAWLIARGVATGVAVPLGRDTRASGTSLLAAVARGLAAAGFTPLDLGIVPTPAVAWHVRHASAPLGVVLTASHNPTNDNGIKFFGPGGVKLADADEALIESLLPDSLPADLPCWPTVAPRAISPGSPPADVATATPDSDAGTPPFSPRTADLRAPVPAAALVHAPGSVSPPAAAYLGALAALLPRGALAGWRIAVDTAHGATCATTPTALRALGADLVSLGAAPDGTNINAGCGSEHPAALIAAVCAHGARLGLAHDGDGDRLVLIDETGAPLDGDEIMALLARDALARDALPGRVLVATVQSNLGLDAALAAAGGRVERTPVGDRYVAERMRALGAALGGESSGHLICADVSPTGDGLVAALRVLAVMVRTGEPLSVLRRALVKFPQHTAALRVREKIPFDQLTRLPAAMREAEAALAGGAGRILVRYSGTEPKLRLLVEARDDATALHWLAALQAAATAELGAGVS